MWGFTPPPIPPSLVQSESSEAIGKSSLYGKPLLSGIAFPKRLEFSYCHSCLSLSNGHRFRLLLSLNFPTDLRFSDCCTKINTEIRDHWHDSLLEQLRLCCVFLFLFRMKLPFYVSKFITEGVS